MNTIDLTSENWLQGKFELKYTLAIFDSNEMNLPPIVDPSSIQKEELTKIHVLQKEIFQKQIEAYTNILITDFNDRYTKSAFPQTTLQMRANEIVATVRGQKMRFGKDDYVVERTGQLISKSFYVNFQNYVNRKLKVEKIDPSFIPSPNSKYFDENKYILPEVYVESLIKLYEHLSKFDETIDPLRLFQDPYKSMYADEPHNDAPDIFTSGYGQLLFCQLEEAIIDASNPKPGDYVFIFKMLGHKEINAFKKGVSVESLFDYINKLNGFKLKRVSNRAADSNLRKNIMRYFLRRHLYKTQSNERNQVENLVGKVIERKTT